MNRESDKHMLRVPIKAVTWNLLWQLKSEKFNLPMGKVLDKVISFYFEKNMLKPDPSFKSKNINTIGQ